MKSARAVAVLAAGALFLGLSGCSKNNPVASQEELKAEAYEFGLQVVQANIEEDATTFMSFLGDTLYIMEHWDEPVPRNQITPSVIADIFAKFDYSGYTMEDYLEVYSPEVLSYDDVKADVGGAAWLDSLRYWRFDEKDFVFDGSQVKPGKQEFMWDDLLVWVVSKRTGQWKIRAASG